MFVAVIPPEAGRRGPRRVPGAAACGGAVPVEHAGAVAPHAGVRGQRPGPGVRRAGGPARRRGRQAAADPGEDRRRGSVPRRGPGKGDLRRDRTTARRRARADGHRGPERAHHRRGRGRRAAVPAAPDPGPDGPAGRGDEVGAPARRLRGPAWTVEEIALVASYLGEGPRNRPRHEVVETFSLGPAGSGPARPAAPPRGR